LASGGHEPRALLAAVVLQAALGLILGFFVLALDYARVLTVLADSRSMLRTWWKGLVFVVRHLPGTAAIGVLAAAGVLGAMAVATAFDAAYSARTWGVILGAIVVHQAMALARTAVRVGQVSAQASYCRGWLPSHPEAAGPAPTSTEPLADEPAVASPHSPL
jgi:hypothetical protein